MFGVPHTLVSDNGLQFDNKAFQRSYCELGIKNKYSTPAYHQSNRQAEATNKVIMDELKKRLDKTKGKWVDELPHVLSAYRTTPRRSTGETPFSMTYGSKAIILLETGFPMMRTNQFNSNRNKQLLPASLDLVEERRKVAKVQMAHCQQKLRQEYDRGIKTRVFVPRDLVLRKVVGNASNACQPTNVLSKLHSLEQQQEWNFEGLLGEG